MLIASLSSAYLHLDRSYFWPAIACLWSITAWDLKQTNNIVIYPYSCIPPLRQIIFLTCYGLPLVNNSLGPEANQQYCYTCIPILEYLHLDRSYFWPAIACLWSITAWDLKQTNNIVIYPYSCIPPLRQIIFLTCYGLPLVNNSLGPEANQQYCYTCIPILEYLHLDRSYFWPAIACLWSITAWDLKQTNNIVIHVSLFLNTST